jgi:hypothetical protein
MSLNGKATVVVITDRALWPCNSGNRLRIIGLLKTLKALGCRTILIASHSSNIGALGAIVDDLHLVDLAPFMGGDPAHFDCSPFVATLTAVLSREQPRAVVVEYLWLAPLLDHCQDFITRAVDAHDVFHERCASLTSLGLDPWVRCDMPGELALLAHADVVLTIQQRETDVLARLLPSTRVSYVPPLLELQGAGPSGTGQHRILVVGSRHTGNAGLIEFATHVWPEIRSRHPAAHLHVVGTIGKELRGCSSMTIDLQMESMADAYAQALIVVCPVSGGAGLKIKMVEALRYGRAVAATSVAADGLRAPAQPCWLEAPTVEALYEPVCRLLVDARLRAVLEGRARHYGEVEFGLVACTRHLSDALGI